LWWVLSALAVAVAIGVVALAAMAIYVTTSPSVSDAEARVDHILQAHRGVDVGLPPPRRLGEAVVAVEDEHFYANFIINILEGAGRAALAALHTSQGPGGSTLAQQLAKQLYGQNGTLREIGLAVKLYVTYSKAQILSMYLDAIYFGNGYWGAARAARGISGSPPTR
jgi:membrane peptidoglycan carboxypeptidase